MGRNWEIAKQAYRKEQGAGRTMKQWFQAGWQGAHHIIPATFEHSIEGCEEAFSHYCVNCKACENKDWVAEDWFCAGFWRFQSWINKQIEDTFNEVEIER
jgi:hypothetical protein